MNLEVAKTYPFLKTRFWRKSIFLKSLIMELLAKVVILVQLLEMCFVVLLARILFLVSLVVIPRSMNIPFCMFQVSFSQIRKLLTSFKDFKIIFRSFASSNKTESQTSRKGKEALGRMCWCFHFATTTCKWLSNMEPECIQKLNMVWYFKWLVGSWVYIRFRFK